MTPRHRRIFTILFLVCSVLALSSHLEAQTASPLDYATARLDRRLLATRAPAPSRSTGRSTKPAWRDAPVATGFLQNEPREGQPATFDTEVRVLYDDHALYFGVFAHDDDPAAIIVSELRKDFNTAASDGFLIVIDTFPDQRNGYEFATNPAGAKWDAQMSNEGRETNANWDGIWDVRTRIARGRLVRGDPDSVPDAEVQRRRSADLGHQLPAPAAPPQRGQLLVAAAAHLPRSIAVSLAGTLEGLQRLRPGATCASSRTRSAARAPRRPAASTATSTPAST